MGHLRPESSTAESGIVHRFANASKNETCTCSVERADIIPKRYAPPEPKTLEDKYSLRRAAHCEAVKSEDGVVRWRAIATHEPTTKRIVRGGWKRHSFSDDDSRLDRRLVKCVATTKGRRLRRTSRVAGVPAYTAALNVVRELSRAAYGSSGKTRTPKL